MPYADSDFFIALLKEEDWLGARAKEILGQYKGSIRTSHWAVVEMLMLAKKYNLDPENLVFRIRQIAAIEGDFAALLGVAHLMKERGMNVFDALHAISCGHDIIISSDKVFDELGLRRIRLGD